jgi:diguanylate cyclase (GGDEF)-like protein
MSGPDVTGNLPEGEDNPLYLSLDIGRLRQLVVKDELTGLYNRRYFHQRLDEECSRWKRHKRPFSLMMADVNDFKEINDHYGHPLGDRVLVEIAGILSASIREIDIVCRYAGDEFVIILPDIEEEGCRGVVERVEENMKLHPWKKRLEVPLKGVSISVGYAHFPADATKMEDLIARADEALYYAKRKNRSSCSFHECESSNFKNGGSDSDPAAASIIGRKEERKQLFRALDRARERRGQFFLIRGELGMGKSRLLGEVEDRAKADGFLLLKGNCFPETRGVPFHPIIQALRSSLKDGRHSTLMKRLPEAWRKELQRILYSSESGLNDLRDEGGSLRKELFQAEFRIFEIFSAFINKFASLRPMMISLENLQWIDSSSIKLLKYIGRQIQDKQALICVTVREDGLTAGDGADASIQHELQSLREESYLHEILLEGLKELEVYAIIDRQIPDGKVDHSMKKRIYDLSEGNPLFASEIINYLLGEKRDLLVGPKGCGAIGPDEIIPPTIYDLIERNIFKLDPEVKSILSYAAVIGQEFDFSVLMAISGKNEGYLLDIIDVAVGAGLIKEVEREEGDQYCFTPYLIGRFLYQSLDEEKRRVLHKRVGEVIEALHAKTLSSHYGILSHHFQKAGEFQKAIEYASLAGEHAKTVYAHREAIRSYTLALELIEKAFVPYPYDKAATFFGKRGRQYFSIGEYPRCTEDFHSMLTCSREADRRDLEATAMVYLSSSLLTRGNLNEAKEWAESALGIGRDLDDRSIMMLALSDLGVVSLYMGSHEVALKYYKESLQLSRELKDDRAITRNITNLGVYYWSVGSYNEAVRYYQRALRRLEKSGDKHLLALNLNNLGAAYFVLGKIGVSVKAYQKSVRLSREILNRSLLAYNYNNLGEIYQILECVDQAMKYHTAALELAREVGERYVECDILRNIGIDYQLQGKTREGVRYLKNALRLSRRVGKVVFMVNSLFDIGRVWLENGDVKKAEMISEELLQRSDKDDNQESRAKAYLLRAKVLQAKKDNSRAMEEINHVLDLLSKVQNPFLSIQALAFKWRICGDGGAGGDALREARSIIRDVVGEIESQELRDGFLGRKDVMEVTSAIGDGLPLSLP